MNHLKNPGDILPLVYFRRRPSLTVLHFKLLLENSKTNGFSLICLKHLKYNRSFNYKKYDFTTPWRHWRDRIHKIRQIFKILFSTPTREKQCMVKRERESGESLTRTFSIEG